MNAMSLERFMLTVNGVDLFVRDTGTSVPPMLCLHGRWGRGERSGLVRRYRDRFRIIAPDQRGHGLSGRPVARYAPEDMAEDAHQLLRALDAAPAVVVGHSMGARNAAVLAARYPHDVRAVALLDCPADGPEHIPSIEPSQISGIDLLTADWPTPYPSYDDALQDIAERFPRPTAVRYFQESLVETVEGYDFLFSRWAMSAIEAYLHGWLHLLPCIGCPTLLVRAADSWDFSDAQAERMRPLIHRLTYVEIGGSDHMVYVDNPSEFDPAFDAWLEAL
jgi:2-succinyl-6-hydroxy-2,4-cyclohexadiene-1-carboxylate synthase